MGTNHPVIQLTYFCTSTFRGPSLPRPQIDGITTACVNLRAQTSNLRVASMVLPLNRAGLRSFSTWLQVAYRLHVGRHVRRPLWSLNDSLASCARLRRADPRCACSLPRIHICALHILFRADVRPRGCTQLSGVTVAPIMYFDTAFDRAEKTCPVELASTSSPTGPQCGLREPRKLLLRLGDGVLRVGLGHQLPLRGPEGRRDLPPVHSSARVVTSS